MRTAIRISDEAAVHIADLANKKGITISEATEQLLKTGYNRTVTLQTWRRKERKQRRAAKRAA